MNQIILSDTAVLGINYQDTKDGINYLKQLQKEGIKIIFLSNRPELCMRKIGIYVNKDLSVSYRYLGACDKKGNGVDFIIYNDTELYEKYNIKPDFSIFGNGISTFDKNDNLVYQASFLNCEQLETMIEIFRKNGYKSYKEYSSLAKDSFGDRCFQPQEKVYKFFTPEIGSDSPNNRIYGMQCSSNGKKSDERVIKDIESAMSEIKGYILNGKPCFYQKKVNKLEAVNFVLNHYNMNILKSLFILSEKTDQLILQQYPNLTQCTGELASLVSKEDEHKSLAKILRKNF